MKRIMALDFGHARVGMAISDPTQSIASALPTIKGHKDPATAARTVATAIQIVCQDQAYDLDTIVVGLPIHLNGSPSPRSQEATIFANELNIILNLPVRLFDERFTSLQADRALKEGNLSRKQRSLHVDSVAALLLLQSFLDSKQL